MKLIYAVTLIALLGGCNSSLSDKQRDEVGDIAGSSIDTDELETKLTDMQDKVDSLESKLTEIEAQLSEHDIKIEDIDGVEDRVSDLEFKLSM